MRKYKTRGKAGFISVYNKIATVYDKRYGKSCEDAQEIVITEIDTINKLFLTVLDIGCGTGELVKKLFDRNKALSFIGIDPSISMLEIAKNKNTEKAKFLLGYAEDLPLKDASVDLIVSTTSISHWFDIKIALSEISRVLKKDGYIIFVEHKKPSIFIKLILATINRLATYRSTSDLYKLFNEMNFTVVRHYTNKKYVISCLIKTTRLK